VLGRVSGTAEMELGIELEDEPPARYHLDFVEKQAAAAAAVRAPASAVFDVRSAQALLFPCLGPSVDDSSPPRDPMHDNTMT
jgi:hypothetical protein